LLNIGDNSFLILSDIAQVSRKKDATLSSLSISILGKRFDNFSGADFLNDVKVKNLIYYFNIV
jgi:hypothetical protein